MRDLTVDALNKPVDVAADFATPENTYFIAGRAVEFDPASASGRVEWRMHHRRRISHFNQVSIVFEPARDSGYMPEYVRDPVRPFSVSFVSPRAVRIRVATRELPPPPDEQSPMLVGPVPVDRSWQMTQEADGTTYASAGGSVRIISDPWRIEIRDASGRLLTQTQNLADAVSLRNTEPMPCSFVERTADLEHRIAATFTLSPDEKLFGCGESFTRLNKRGQKVVLWTRDACGAQSPEMYKPIPFFLSSRGYGMFVHTSAPLTFDFGHSYDVANTIYSGDEYLDLFVFLGSPQEILTEYTAITGRSPTPPLWSFGLWMSRITYFSEAEVREVARKLRAEQVPADVIHIDTGWFETDWRCDYEFSKTRFDDPAKLIADLREQGFRICLWQLPYITPQNALFREAVERGYAVRSGSGGLPTEDAVIDFSNPAAVEWYQEKLAGLLRLGVGAIKVDFGEGAPRHGIYASGRSGHYEHNLYPLRYNRAAYEITERETHEPVIWARSAWAGSQRYPLHWSGDAENTDSAMAGTLRGGLSFGLCGFSFWSHDVGGFAATTPRALYRRWLPFGALTSHTRCHGMPPKEPWLFEPSLTPDFQRAIGLKYRLMPYIYAQARQCSERGHPMVRPLFFEYPADPASWQIEDEYLLGTDVVVAPLFEETTRRQVYLPPATWIDYQTGRAYAGGRWHEIEAGEIPAIVLVRAGAAIPHAKLAQHTGEIDWSQLELVVYGDEPEARGFVALPSDGDLRPIHLSRSGEGYAVDGDPLEGRARLSVRRA